MAQVNLLPWREQRRAELKTQFFVVLGVMALVGVVLVSSVNGLVQKKIGIQDARNELIKIGQAGLEEDIETITKLEKQRDQLTGRLRVIQDLQGKRSVIVHQLDEITRIIPDGIYLTKLTKEGEKFQVEGIAQVNAQISHLLRNFSHSVWFKDPVLAGVDAREGQDSASRGNHFALSVLENIPGGEQVNNPEMALSGTNGS